MIAVKPYIFHLLLYCTCLFIFSAESVHIEYLLINHIHVVRLFHNASDYYIIVASILWNVETRDKGKVEIVMW